MTSDFRKRGDLKDFTEKKKMAKDSHKILVFAIKIVVRNGRFSSRTIREKRFQEFCDLDLDHEMNQIIQLFHG